MSVDVIMIIGSLLLLLSTLVIQVLVCRHTYRAQEESKKVLIAIRSYSAEQHTLLPTGRERRRVEAEVLILMFKDHARGMKGFDFCVRPSGPVRSKAYLQGIRAAIEMTEEWAEGGTENPLCKNQHLLSAYKKENEG